MAGDFRVMPDDPCQDGLEKYAPANDLDIGGTFNVESTLGYGTTLMLSYHRRISSNGVVSGSRSTETYAHQRLHRRRSRSHPCHHRRAHPGRTPGLSCLAAYATGESRSLGRPHAKPDVLLVDIRLLAHVRHWRPRNSRPAPKLQILMVTTWRRTRTDLDSLRAGASGYIPEKRPEILS